MTSADISFDENAGERYGGKLPKPKAVFLWKRFEKGTQFNKIFIGTIGKEMVFPTAGSTIEIAMKDVKRQLHRIVDEL